MSEFEKKMEYGQEVKNRRVHYFAGFDPRGARYYHQLYAEEAAKQALVNGGRLDVGKRHKVGTNVVAWTIQGDWQGSTVTTEYEFMEWDDVVRRHWDTSFLALLWHGLPTYIRYASGLNRIRKIAPNAFYTTLFPLVYLLLLALTMVVVGFLADRFGLHYFDHAAKAAVWGVAFSFVIGWAGILVAEELSVLWVLRTYVFIVMWGIRKLPDMEDRIEKMAAHILRERETHPADEIVLIGHSVGSIVAVTVAARMLARTPSSTPLTGISLLTLGQCIPYLSFIPSAKAIRRDLEVMGNDDRISWMDATSPPDPLCFFQVDPLRVSGVTPRYQDRPKRIVVRVFKMFGPEAYAKIRRNKRRLHFQYLMASELAAAYDYFEITAGPRRLQAQACVAEQS